jgi:hypothetical protein
MSFSNGSSKDVLQMGLLSESLGIHYAGQDAQGVASKEDNVAKHILSETRSHHDHIIWITRFRHLLKKEIHQTSKSGTVTHEQLGHSKENFGSLRPRQDLPGIVILQQLQKSANHRTTFERIFPYRIRVMKHTCRLQDGSLFNTGVLWQRQHDLVAVAHGAWRGEARWMFDVIDVGKYVVPRPAVQHRKLLCQYKIPKGDSNKLP